MKKPQLVVYDLFMLVLCIISLTIVLVQLTAAVPAEIENILNTFDFIICLVFMYDFLRSFYLAESKGIYEMGLDRPALQHTYNGLVAIGKICQIIKGIQATKRHQVCKANL